MKQESWRVGALVAVAAGACGLLLWRGPMTQDSVLPGYHDFADQRTLWGIPNFWNVATNGAFLLAAVWGARALRLSAAFEEIWERQAFGIMLAGVALVAAGSGYYHWRPDDGSLFWDRLPMAVVFTSLLAATVGERLSARWGRRMLYPAVAAGVVSVLVWRWTGDLRLYLLAQFGAVLGIPLLMLLFPARYTGGAGVAAMVALYALALAFDRMDGQLAAFLPLGGHPFKHIAAAAAMFCYLRSVAGRRELPRRPERWRTSRGSRWPAACPCGRS